MLHNPIAAEEQDTERDQTGDRDSGPCQAM